MWGVDGGVAAGAGRFARVQCQGLARLFPSRPRHRRPPCGKSLIRLTLHGRLGKHRSPHPLLFRRRRPPWVRVCNQCCAIHPPDTKLSCLCRLYKSQPQPAQRLQRDEALKLSMMSDLDAGGVFGDRRGNAC